MFCCFYVGRSKQCFLNCICLGLLFVMGPYYNGNSQSGPGMADFVVIVGAIWLRILGFRFNLCSHQVALLLWCLRMLLLYTSSHVFRHHVIRHFVLFQCIDVLLHLFRSSTFSCTYFVRYCVQLYVDANHEFHLGLFCRNFLFSVLSYVPSRVLLVFLMD